MLKHLTRSGKGKTDIIWRGLSSGVEKLKGHWLDEYFPNVRPWLQRQNRNWWIYGIKSRCSQFHVLRDQKEKIHLYVEKAYLEYHERHVHRVKDGPSQTHLQVACLVLASYKVLFPWIKTEQDVLEILAGQMGSSGAPILRGLLHSTLYIRHKFLGTSPFAILSRMMRTLQLDMGAAWTSTLHSTEKHPSRFPAIRDFVVL